MQTIDFILIAISVIIVLTVFVIALIRFFKISRNVKYEIVCFVADKGAGKTTLACALADLFHRKYEPIVRQQLEPFIDYARNNGFPNINLPKDTLVFADTECYTSVDDNNREQFIKSYDCNISKFRLPTDNNHKLIDYYPYGSYLIFDEIANKAMSRDFANFSKNLTAMLNLTRKFSYNISFIWPDYMGTDKIIRNSCHIIRLVRGCELLQDKKGNNIGMRWWFVDYSGPDRIENFQNGEIPQTPYRPFKMFSVDRKPIEKWYFEYKGDIGNLCATKREELYMLNHFTRWSLRKQREYMPRRKDVREFVKENPPFGDNLADIVDNRSVAEKRKRLEKGVKESEV